MSGKKVFSCCILFVFLFGAISVRAAEKNSSLLILPFDINAAGKYSYLKESIRNMLSARLAAKDGIEIRDYELSQKEISGLRTLKKREAVRALFARLHADYIVTGTLYSVSNRLNLRLTFYPAQIKGKPMEFSMLADNENAILPALNRLVGDIGKKLAMLSEKVNANGKVARGQMTGQQALPSQGMNAFQTANPERMYKKGIYSSGGVAGAESAGVKVSSRGVRRSTQLSMNLVSMAVGDLDGDGVDEIVLAAPGKLAIYHFQNGRFSQIAKAAISSRLKINALNLADPGRTGRDTIYLSATDGNTISSLIARWDMAHGLQILHRDIHWFIRPLTIPGKGVVLAGQKETWSGLAPIFSPVYRLKFKMGSNEPIKGEKVSLPDNIKLFDFTFADLKGDGDIEKVVIDSHNKLLVYDQNNTLLWVSHENYGGSLNYLGSNWNEPVGSEEKIYVPIRIIAVNLYGQKKQQILVAKNNRTSWAFLKNFRTYNGGSISCLQWKKGNLYELWHTNTLTGMIADFSLRLHEGKMGGKNRAAAGSGIKTAANSKSLQLFIGDISNTEPFDILLSADNETSLYAYDLDLTPDKTKK